jgi:hypothetical protein
MAKKEKNSDDIPSLATQNNCNHQGTSVETSRETVRRGTAGETEISENDCNNCNSSYTEYR